MNNDTRQVRDLQRKKEIHSNNANVAAALLNTDKNFIIQKGKLSLRISTGHPYYAQLQAVLNDIAAHHVGLALNADAYLNGIPIPDHIIPMI